MNKFRRMEIFVAIVEAGQITRASEVLHLSKSAVSHALTDLETHMNLKLIDKTGGDWQLTEAGSHYYNQSKKILTDIKAMEDEVRQESQTLTGLIRLSAPVTYGTYTLVPIISEFLKIHPKILIELNLAERSIDMIGKRIDLSFRLGDVNDKSLEVHKVGESQLMMCASPAYLEKFGRPKTHLDLKNHKCLRYTGAEHWQFMKEGRRFKFMPKDHILTDNGETIRQFCIHGQGLAYIPSLLTEPFVRKGFLIKVLTDYEFGKLPILAVRIADNRASTRVTQLLNFITNALRGQQELVS